MTALAGCERLVERVQRECPCATAADAARAVEATVAMLGATLYAHERDELAGWLPPALQPVLRTAAYGAHVTAEHVAVVCGALADVIGPEGRRWIERRLGPEWSELFAVPPPPPHLDPARRAPGTATTLAEGRPGSRHPVSEAPPPRKG